MRLVVDDADPGRRERQGFVGRIRTRDREPGADMDIARDEDEAAWRARSAIADAGVPGSSEEAELFGTRELVRPLIAGLVNAGDLEIAKIQFLVDQRLGEWRHMLVDDGDTQRAETPARIRI